MADYKNGKIYVIKNPECTEVYIGSTVQTLCERLMAHRRQYICWKNGTHNYVSSFKLFEIGEPMIELLEEYPCDSKAELDRREGEIIKATENCVNKVIPGRTQKEYVEVNRDRISKYKKEYFELNRDHIEQYQKEYRENNRDRIREYQKDYREAKKKASLDV